MRERAALALIDLHSLHLDPQCRADIHKGVRYERRLELSRKRERQIKEWFTEFYPFNSGVINFDRQGIVDDPRELFESD